MNDKNLNVRIGLQVDGRKTVDDASGAIDGLGANAQAMAQKAVAGAEGVGKLDAAAKGMAGQSGQAADKLGALGTALKAAGVDTAELDQRAEALAAELAKTGGASANLADAEQKLAPVARAAAEATTELAKAAKDSTSGLAGLGDSSESAKAKLGEMKLELAAAGAAAYTIGRALGSAAREASGFESAMAEVSTLVDDVSGMDAQADAVRNLAREYGGDAVAQAKALYQVISAGAEQGAQAVGVLDQANKLAVGGVTDITTAADGLTSVMNAYGAAAGTVAEVSDAFFVAMKAGKTTVGELSNSIGQVAPISAQAGVGLTELLAATAALTKGNSDTSASVTQLRAILTSVIKPTKEAADLALELGLAFDVQALKSKGLAGFLQDVRDKTGGSTETMAQLFGSVEALNGALALTGNQAGTFGDTLGQMANRAGATDEAFAKVAGTSEHAAKKFQAALNDVQISAGQALTAFTPLLEVVTSAINVFNDLPAPLKTVVAGVGALAVAAVPAALAVSSITKAVGLASAALGIKRAAVLALPVPLTAAAGATTALGVAAGASVAPVTAGAGAVGVLTRAVGALAVASKALFGPWTLLLTAVGYGASKFVEAKGAAEAADVANRKMLEGPSKSELAAKVKAAADKTNELAEAAAKAQTALEKQQQAAEDAAKVVGVDLVLAGKGVSAEFDKQSAALDTLVGSFGLLREQGVDTGDVLRQALAKLIDTAKVEGDFEKLGQRILSAGLDAKTAGDLFTKMLDTRLNATRTQEDVDKVAESISRLKDKFPELRNQISEWEDKAVASSKKVGTELSNALHAFGIKSKDQLRSVADDAKRSWEIVRESTQVALADKVVAFAKYREVAIAANEGVESSEIKLQREQLASQAIAAGTGDVYTKAMATASKAIDGARGSVKALKADTKATYAEIFADQARYQKALKESAAYSAGANAGVGSLGGKSDVLSLGEWNASVKSTIKSDWYNADGSIKSDFSIDQKSGTIGSFQLKPPDDSGNWVLDAELYNRTGQTNWSYTGDPANLLQQGFGPRLNVVPNAPYAQPSAVLQPTLDMEPIAAAVASSAVTPFAAASSDSDLSRLAAAVDQLVATIKAGLPQGALVAQRYEVVLRSLAGQTSTVQMTSEQAVADFLRVLGASAMRS